MADEAVSPTRSGEGGRTRGDLAKHGEWVRATDAAGEERVRWIEDGAEWPAPPAEEEERSSRAR